MCSSNLGETTIHYMPPDSCPITRAAHCQSPVNVYGKNALLSGCLSLGIVLELFIGYGFVTSMRMVLRVLIQSVLVRASPRVQHLIGIL